LRDQWNTPVTWVPSAPIFERVHEIALHAKPIIPIFTEVFYWLLTYPLKRLELLTSKLRQAKKSLDDCKIFYFDASKTIKVLKAFQVNTDSYCLQAPLLSTNRLQYSQPVSKRTWPLAGE